MGVRNLLTLSLPSLLWGCLQDAPAPAQCPPPAPANSCASLAPNTADTCGVMRDDARKCLGLPVCKPKCDSAAQQCPDNPSACYPPGDCPSAVTALNPDSACVRLPSASLKENEFECTCGCAGCLSVCDGTGLTVYRDVPPSDAGAAIPFATIDLQGLLPDRGSLSVYAVLRGSGTLHVEATGDASDSTGTADLRTKSAASWQDVVPFKTTSPDGKRLSWGQDANSRPPKRLTLSASEGAVALELDCVVPVVTP